MSMHDRLEEAPETVQDLEQAALDRLAEAKELVAAGQTTGAAYLAGYVAEMVLKMATFRINGHLPNDAVRPLLAPARHRAKAAYGDGLDHHNFHSVLFWALLLAADRRRLGRPAAIATQTVNRARHIHEAWAVSMRYRSDVLDLEGAKKVLEEVGWMHSNRLRLWS